jgi:hypothetical protein
VVNHSVGAEIHFRQHLHQLIEQVILDQLGNDLFKLEVLDDLQHVLGIAIQVFVEIELNILRILGQPAQVI